ncbi:MAG: PocR ligand-binding domain-containing protein [Treponema sp.]|nr:PocR ligand-binding domain-containing protein [Treponema sp.]
MDMIWDKDKMHMLMKSFHTLINARIGFYDLNGKEIVCYPTVGAKYCDTIWAYKSGLAACKRCDEYAFQQAAKRKTPYIYQCHAGLTEIAAPVITSENIQIGYVMIGQARPPGDKSEAMWKNLGKKASYPVTDTLKYLYSELPVLDRKRAEACTVILQALATNAWYDNYYRFQKEPLSSKVSHYIIQNLDREISVNDIAREFKIGKTTLCKSVKRDLQITVNGLIRAERIKKAKELLLSAELPIYLIAEDIGIPDYNYFTKVFKAEIGVTPSVFRKSCENHAR